jgi:hypothetical protein
MSEPAQSARPRGVAILLTTTFFIALAALALSIVALTAQQPGRVGPAGATGDPGPPGPAGPQGAAGVPLGVYVLSNLFGGCPSGTSGSLSLSTVTDDRGNAYDLCQVTG